MRHYICCTDELPDGGSYMRVVADAETFESAQQLYNQVCVGPEGYRMHLISKEDYDKNYYGQEAKVKYQKEEEVRETTEDIIQNKTTETMTEEELIRITIKVALIAADMNTDLEKDQNVTDEFVEDLSNRVSTLEEKLANILNVGEKHANQLQSIIDRNEIQRRGEFSKKARGSYRKKLKPKVESEFTETGERKTIVLKKGVSGNIFGAKTTSKYNKAITRALNSKAFTSVEIIAEVRRKHAKVHRFSGKELLYQVKKAKWRLDSNKRRRDGVGVYAKKESKELNFSTNKGFSL